MTDNILTPLTLWSGFDDSLPLKESKINVVSFENADYNYIYFSGRKTNVDRVRVYGLYAKQKNSSKGSILILPDAHCGIDEDLTLRYVKDGFDVLFIDYGGERDGIKNCTKYPQDISYANFKECGRTFYYADKTAKETCWYEWVAVARYAVSFLYSKNPDKPIFTIGIKYGANVLWQLAAIDKRVSAAVFLFGAGWLTYKDANTQGSEVEMNDERFRFLAAADAQAYAQYVTCPVLYLGSTNNNEFKAERSVDTLSRIPNQSIVNFAFTSASVDVLDGEMLKNVDIFLNDCISRKNACIVEVPQLTVDYNNGVMKFTVSAFNKADVDDVCVYTSFNDTEPQKLVWYKVTGDKKDKKGNSVFTYKLSKTVDFSVSYASVKYKNGYTLTSRLVAKKIGYKCNVKISNVIYSADMQPIEFIASGIKQPSICNVFVDDKLYETVIGPSEIKGISSMNDLTTYAIGKRASGFTETSFVKFDVYTPVFLNLTLVLSDDVNEYSYDVSINGGEVWQNIMVEITEFKNEDGLQILDVTKITSLTFKSLGRYTINNIMVL